MIAKLFAFGVSPLSLKLIYFCLSNQTQRIEINENFGDRTDIESGVPQCSVLGPFWFNVDMTDLFYECKYSNDVSYADNLTPYSCATDIPSAAL